MMLRKMQRYFNADGVGGGAGTGEQAAGTEPESLLFPKDVTADSAADGSADNKTPADSAADWKEYEPDPAKSEEENAAAKAEHDKTKPADDKKDAPENKVPEDGKYELKMPEGVEVDAELLDAISPRFKELGLTRAQAQALADDFVKVQQQRAETQTTKWAETVNGWAEQARNDKDIGGDKFNTSVSDAQRAIAKLGTPALKEYLEASGGGNHPEVIRVLAKAGALLKEDNPPNGDGKGQGKPAEVAHLLFPTDAPKG